MVSVSTSGVRNGQWQKNIGPEHFGTDVHGKTLGIIGMGRIGEALAQRGHFGFGMPVIYHSHSPKPAVEARFDAQYRSLEQLLQEADFICLTLPLTAETEGLIGREQFALMRPERVELCPYLQCQQSGSQRHRGQYRAGRCGATGQQRFQFYAPRRLQRQDR